MKRRDRYIAILFIAPSLIGFMLFFLIPFIISIYYSVVNSPVNGKFIGFSNYYLLLTNPVFLRAALNTLIFTLISVPLVMILSITFALILNKAVYGRNILRTFFISPLVIPGASIILVWQLVFSEWGTLNGILTTAGLGSIDWMNSKWARVVVLIVYIWKNVGYNIVLFLAGLQNIPVEYYEAAYIDGATPFRRFASITLVYLTPASFFIFIISIINSFKVFRETYLIAGSYPHESIYMLQHYMNNMFTSLDYQKLTSAALIMAMLIFLLVVLLFSVERKISRTLE